MIFRYENTICDIDPTIFKRDKISFFVLERILKGNCTLTISDKESFIICYSCEPHPVWIWLKDDASSVLMDNVLEILKKEFGFDGKFQFNSKYFFYEYAKSKGLDLKIHLNLLTYACPLPVAPKKQAKGEIILATENYIDLATDMIFDFQESVGITSLTREQCKSKVIKLTTEKRLFFLINNGEIVAMCAYNPLNDMASINCVYTLPNHRRCGYGAMVVYHVTRYVISEGYLPILYADGDYPASNECYKSIGYVLDGGLCTFE